MRRLRRFRLTVASEISPLWALLFLFLLAVPARAIDHVTINRDGVRRILQGKVLVERNGGLLVQTRDGVLWLCQPDEIEARKEDSTEFTWLSTEEMQARILADLPSGYRVHRTKHFLICYNTTEVYARWCGSLYERLYDAYFAYWKKLDWELDEPTYVLPAVIHRDKSSFAREARKEVGDGANVIVGYYSMRTNRVNMYDLTGADNLRPVRGKIRTSAHINKILSQPGAERTVATIVHEATHQLAYNSGLQTRYVGNPFWVSEGMAVFFESPDLKSSRGWRGIGAKHRVKLVEYKRNVPTRRPDALRIMLSEDAAFQSSATADAAYADAWAFNYYLIRRRPKEYVNFLQKLAKLKPLDEWSPARRVEEFEKSMAMDIVNIEQEFTYYMRRVR